MMKDSMLVMLKMQKAFIKKDSERTNTKQKLMKSKKGRKREGVCIIFVCQNIEHWRNNNSYVDE